MLRKLQKRAGLVHTFCCRSFTRWRSLSAWEESSGDVSERLLIDQIQMQAPGKGEQRVCAGAMAACTASSATWAGRHQPGVLKICWVLSVSEFDFSLKS